MKRWVFFLITFLIFSALFLLGSGEYRDSDAGSEPLGPMGEAPVEDPRFVVQIVDQKENVLLGILWAGEIEMMGDLVKVESIAGLQLKEVELEVYHSEGRETVRIRSPEGRVSKEKASGGGEIHLKAALSGGVVVDFQDGNASLRTEAMDIVVSGTSRSRRISIHTRSAKGEDQPVVIEGIDPFGRIEAASAVADLSREMGGELRLQSPVKAKASGALARGLAIFSGEDVREDEMVEVRNEGEVVLRGFISGEGKPEVSPAGETVLLFQGRTRISRAHPEVGELEADQLTVRFQRTGALPSGKGEGETGSPGAGEGRIQVSSAEAVGNVDVRRGEFHLEAGTVRWDPLAETAEALGAPKIRDILRGWEIRFGADRISFETRGNRVEMDGQVSGRMNDLEGASPGERRASGWRFLADRLELQMAKDEETGKLVLSWGEARTAEGRPMVISDDDEETIITGRRLTFSSTMATLWGGEEAACHLKHGKSRFTARRVDLERKAGSVALSGEVRGAIHAEDLGGEETDDQTLEPIRIVSDLLLLEIRLPEEIGKGATVIPEEGRREADGRVKSQIRSILARGQPARVEVGNRGIQSREIAWDLQTGVIVTRAGRSTAPDAGDAGKKPADGDDWRPLFWDDNLQFDAGGIEREEGVADERPPVKVRLEGGSLEVRTREGKAYLRGGFLAWITDGQGREWRGGGDLLEVLFTPVEEGTGGFLLAPEGEGRRRVPKILTVRGRRREGGTLWLEGEAGRLEGGELEWSRQEGSIRLFGGSGCWFKGETEDGITLDLRAAEIRLDPEARSLDLRGSIRGDIIPRKGLLEGKGSGKGLREAEEALRKAGKDAEARWTIRCENIRVEYVLKVGDEGSGPDARRNAPAVRRFHADGGEGLVVIRSEANDIKLTGTTVDYDLSDVEGGWLRMGGSESFSPRLEVGKRGENVMLSREIAVHLEGREAVLDGDVRMTFHSAAVRKFIPGTSEEIPGLLWVLSSERVHVSFPEGRERIGEVELVAEGPVTFQAGELEVEADGARYHGGSRTLVLTGEPLRVKEGGKGVGTASELKCDLGKDRFSVKEAKGWTLDRNILEKIRRGEK